jgi:hypothetical protein
MSTKNDIDNIYRQIKFYMILSEYEKYGLKYYRFRSMAGACDECTKRSEIIFFASEALNNRHCFDSHPNCKCVVELINASGEVLLTLDADGNVKKSILDSISELLTYASFVPGVDTIADIAAIPVDLLRGDFVSAGLDLLGAVPVYGEGADAAKIVRMVDTAKIANRSSKGTKLLNEVSNPKLKNTIKEMYRPGAKVGDGGLADAIRYEIKTGKRVGGKSHIQKGTERLRNLERIFELETLTKHERRIAEDLIKDLKRALGGK